MHRRDLLGTITNVALLILVAYAFVEFRQARATPTVSAAFAVNDKAPALRLADYGASEATVVLFLNSGCRYCTASVPFYKTLLEQRRRRNASVQFVVIGIEQQQALEQYVTTHRLAVDRVEAIDRATWSRLRATPTIVIVNREGRVQGSWMGELSQASQQEVLRALGWQVSSRWWQALL